MKLALISDLHLVHEKPVARKDNAAATGLTKLGYILNYCSSNGIKYLIQAGDLTNVSRSWPLLPLIIKVLRPHIKNVKILAVFGQHDLYMRNKSNKWATMLGVLARTGLVSLLDKLPIIIPPDVAVYGCSYGGTVPDITDKKFTNILAIHAPISDHMAYPGSNIVSAKKFLIDNDFDLVICGDIHKEFYYEIGSRVIVNTAPMLRVDADKYNMNRMPFFYVYDTDYRDLEKVDIPAEPGKAVLSRKHIRQQKHIEEMLNEFTNALKVRRSKQAGVNIVKNIRSRLNDDSIDRWVKEIIKEVIGHAH